MHENGAGCACPADVGKAWPCEAANKRLRDDYERAGDPAGFGAYLDGLRERQRRKYSFIAKLDAAFGA